MNKDIRGNKANLKQYRQPPCKEELMPVGKSEKEEVRLSFWKRLVKYFRLSTRSRR